MSTTYSSQELEQLVLLKKEYITDKIMRMNAREALRWRYNLQKSCAQYAKLHKEKLDVQYEIIGICSLIEKIVRPAINEEHRKNVLTKNPGMALMPQKLKSLLRGKTEETIKKLSY